MNPHFCDERLKINFGKIRKNHKNMLISFELKVHKIMVLFISKLRNFNRFSFNFFYIKQEKKVYRKVKLITSV